jgi:hypothetical protein
MQLTIKQEGKEAALPTTSSNCFCMMVVFPLTPESGWELHHSLLFVLHGAPPFET